MSFWFSKEKSSSLVLLPFPLAPQHCQDRGDDEKGAGGHSRGRVVVGSCGAQPCRGLSITLRAGWALLWDGDLGDLGGLDVEPAPCTQHHFLRRSLKKKNKPRT